MASIPAPVKKHITFAAHIFAYVTQLERARTHADGVRCHLSRVINEIIDQHMAQNNGHSNKPKKKPNAAE